MMRVGTVWRGVVYARHYTSHFIKTFTLLFKSHNHLAKWTTAQIGETLFRN